MIDEPTVTIMCDKCGDTEDISPSYIITGGYDCSDESIREKATGWTFKDGQDLCVYCSSEEL